MKKIIATVLAMVMALALCTVAFATEITATPRPEGAGGCSVFFQLLEETRRKKVYNIMMFTL